MGKADEVKRNIMKELKRISKAEAAMVLSECIKELGAESWVIKFPKPGE